MDIKEFINDRYEAMLSLDKKKIIAYCNKYNISVPLDDEIFWAGVHKTICNLYFSENTRVTLKQYTTSCDWLQKHGYSPFINGKAKKNRR